jgi:recombination associated protein RdgC
MWFKNIFLYRLPTDLPISAATLEEKLSRQPLQPCGGLDKQSRGWVSPQGNGPLVHALNRQLLIALGTEQKLLPAAIINQFAKDRIAELEAQQGHRVGRKETKEIKERITDELLPRAFALRRTTFVWIDPVNGWLVVDAASPAKADEVLELLVKTLDDLPLKPLHTRLSPVTAMTGWLAGGEAPSGFTVDRELELRSIDEGKATVRYVRHDLEGDEIRAHIAAGKSATRLGMTWNDKISFVLTEQLQIKRLAFLDILKEEAESQAENNEELFDLDFTLMTGELARLLADLVEALGGENLQQA